MEMQRPPFDPNGTKTLQFAFPEYGGYQPAVGKAPAKDKFMYTIRYVQALSTRPPWRTVMVILWVLLSGWALFLAYLFAGLLMMLTIILIPFGIQAIRFAVFVLNPIGKESYVPSMAERGDGFLARITSDPFHPFTIFANLVWLIFFGWLLALGHIFLALVQFLTVIGFSNGITNLKLARFALWPFGRQIRQVPPNPWPLPPNTVPVAPAVQVMHTPPIISPPVMQYPVPVAQQQSQAILDGGGRVTPMRSHSVYSRPASAAMA